jgi:anti-sigma B factor antagonist
MKEVQTIGLQDGKLHFVLSGEIDASGADEFFEIVATAYEKQPADIAFDCENLEFIDSTTLGTFVKILKKAKTDGNALSLCSLQPKIKKLFLICALDKIMEIA